MNIKKITKLTFYIPFLMGILVAVISLISGNEEPILVIFVGNIIFSYIIWIGILTVLSVGEIIRDIKLRQKMKRNSLIPLIFIKKTFWVHLVIGLFFFFSVLLATGVLLDAIKGFVFAVLIWTIAVYILAWARCSTL